MNKSPKFFLKVCEPAVRMVLEHLGESPRIGAVVKSVVSKVD